MSSKLHLPDIWLQSPGAQSNLERALARQRQSLASRLGISPADVLFFLSSRNLTKSNGNAVSVRRASDSKTTVIPFRPVVAYNAPRNLLHYNPTTWAEWTIVRVIGGSDGIEFQANGIATSTAYCDMSIMSGKKYGFLYAVVSNTIVNAFGLGDAFNWGQLSKTIGNNKYVETAVGSTNSVIIYTQIAAEPSGNKIKLKDIRVFELPAGSQIEADFTNLTADQLNAKYPMVGANGAPIGAVPGVQKDRVANAFANGDGRYGTVGWWLVNGTLTPQDGGVRAVGSGLAININLQTQKGMYVLPTSTSRKYFVRVFVTTPVAASSCNISSFNGTTPKNISILPQVPAGTSGWATGILTQTDLGASYALLIYIISTFPDAATQNGKVLDVRYWSIISMGDTSADPLYNKTAAEMDAYLRTQPGVVLLPDGEYYVPPRGLCAGEQDLDVTAAFGDTSQLFVTTAYGQEANTNDATQVTAASQPKIWDNGLSYCGLGLFDGSNDFMAADLPDITGYPFTVARRINTKSVSGWSFARNGNGAGEVQYGMYFDTATNLVHLYLNGASVASIASLPNRDSIVAFVCNGSTIQPYLILDGVLTTGTPQNYSTAITTRANKFIGCISSNAGGTTQTGFLSGSIQELEVINKALTADQVQKLWR